MYDAEASRTPASALGPFSEQFHVLGSTGGHAGTAGRLHLALLLRRSAGCPSTDPVAPRRAIMLIDPPHPPRFALAAAAIWPSPGPDTMLILRAALGASRWAGLAAVTRVQLGLAVHILAGGGRRLGGDRVLAAAVQGIGNRRSPAHPALAGRAGLSQQWAADPRSRCPARSRSCVSLRHVFCNLLTPEGNCAIPSTLPELPGCPLAVACV